MNKWHVDYTKDDYERKWKEVRRRILKRDRYQCRVFVCSVKGSKNLTVHHITPRSAGGNEDDSNLITLCPKHHDEIEIAGVQQEILIEAWESQTENYDDTKYNARMILSHLGEHGASVNEQTVESGSIGASGRKPASRHVCADSTVSALVGLLEGSTLAEVAKGLRYHPQFASTISAIVRRKPGAISAANEDELRRRLNLPSLQVGITGRVARTIVKQKVYQKPGRKPQTINKASLVNARLVVNAAYLDLGNWDTVANHYGISKAAAHRLANDENYRPSQSTIDRILAAPKPQCRKVLIDPCPDCGNVHDARCHGNGGPAVVLAPGETVRQPAQPRTRRSYCRLCLPASLTPEQRAAVKEYAAQLAGPVPGMEGGAR